MHGCAINDVNSKEDSCQIMLQCGNCWNCHQLLWHCFGGWKLRYGEQPEGLALGHWAIPLPVTLGLIRRWQDPFGRSDSLYTLDRVCRQSTADKQSHLLEKKCCEVSHCFSVDEFHVLWRFGGFTPWRCRYIAAVCCSLGSVKLWELAPSWHGSGAARIGIPSLIQLTLEQRLPSALLRTVSLQVEVDHIFHT